MKRRDSKTCFIISWIADKLLMFGVLCLRPEVFFRLLLHDLLIKVRYWCFLNSVPMDLQITHLQESSLSYLSPVITGLNEDQEEITQARVKLLCLQDFVASTPSHPTFSTQSTCLIDLAFLGCYYPQWSLRSLSLRSSPVLSTPKT